MPTFTTPEPIDLELVVPMGYVELVASDRTDTVVEVLPTNVRRSGDVTLAAEASAVFAEGRLRVSVPKRLNLFGPGDSVDVRLLLPTGSRASVEVAYGSVRARGALGASRVICKYGPVTLESTADLSLTTPYGDVEIEEVAGNLDLTAGHARLSIRSVTGSTRIKGSHGSLQFDAVGGDFEARTSGVVLLGRAGGDVTVQTAYGAVRIGEVSGGAVRVENGYGEVAVGVPHGVAAWVDAASQHGAVRNELTPEAGPEGSERTVELRLRTNYGDVIISRAQQRGKS